jgi:hypothetical protein
MRNSIKNVLIGGCMLAELTLFGYIALYGSHGFNALYALKKECCLIDHRIEQTKAAIEVVQKKAIAFNAYPFYKEKIARQQLHLAHKDDIIYYTDV